MKEIWKTISDFNNYEISSLGNVRNITTGKVLKPILISTGYYQVVLYKQNKRYRKLIHRLVADAFLENPENLPQINHRDEDKANNAVSNLEWCSASYNANYGTRNKRIAKTLKKSMLGNKNSLGKKNGLGNKSKSKKVKCVQTGEIFNCTRDAAKKYNLEIFSVCHAANPNQKQKTAGGFTWCYI